MNFAGIKNIIKLLCIMPFLIGIWLIVLIELGLVYVDVEQADRDDTLAAYQKEAQLDPDNAEGWNQLGLLLLRTGELAQAEEAFRKVLALGEAHQDKEVQVGVLGNLGGVYRVRGELDKAEEMHLKSLELNKALGRKEGMANQYTNLGSLYEDCGKLDNAEAMWRKSLSLYEEMGAMRHPKARMIQQALLKVEQADRDDTLAD
ncbi:MAG: tetratricopeptide repeat protein [Candidatus Electrothrix sp. ATG2]|nr:tetratricopeptide repeat protein [Candidatus Electrothrix sp. ATG2]